MNGPLKLVALLGLLAVIAVIALTVVLSQSQRREVHSEAQTAMAPAYPYGRIGAPETPAPILSGDCARPAAMTSAAAANAASLSTLRWSPFGRDESGWEVYAPKTAVTLRTGCPPQSPGFAQALAGWQTAHKLPADGVFKPEEIKTMIIGWHRERPFVASTSRGLCPAPAVETALATASAADGYSGKIVRLRPGALDAYRRMVAAAKAEVPGLSGDPQMLKIFSGYRSPAETAEACAAKGGCFKPVSSGRCSAHRTGLALDIVMGAAPGARVDSSEDANRLFMSRTPAYRWMLLNAGRFGFVNYPFEPWHWEWIGETPLPGEPMAPAAQ
jgi:D-alanyl-D-alanine carboxypeptidase